MGCGSSTASVKIVPVEENKVTPAPKQADPIDLEKEQKTIDTRIEYLKEDKIATVEYCYNSIDYFLSKVSEVPTINSIIFYHNLEKEVKFPSNIKVIKFSPYFRDLDGFSTFMKCLSSIPDLENLDISENLFINLDDLNANINKKYLSKLVSLDLSGNKITNLIDFSTNLVNLPQLEVLDLSCNNFYNEEEGFTPFFKNLSSISKLKSLNISYNSFVDIQEFGNNLTYLTDLTNLKMICVNMKDKGVKELSASFKTITNLTELDISLNRLDEENGKEICNAIPSLVNLTKLKMNNMDFNNSHLQILLDSMSSLTNLKEIVFTGNITEGKEELQQEVKDKYPNCQITL